MSASAFDYTSDHMVLIDTDLGTTLTNNNVFRLPVGEAAAAAFIQNGIFAGRFAAPSTTAPGDTSLIWPDTNVNPTVYRYWTGAAWVAADWYNIWDISASLSGKEVNATDIFGTNNRLVRTDGTVRNVQASGVSLDDSDNISGINNLTVGGNITASGTVIGNENVAAFGATGDGVTDDTAAIQAAIDAANTAGGGVVFFSEGTFLVSDTDADGHALELKSGVTLVGAGRGVSVIKLAADENDTTVVKLNAAQTDITIRSLTVDGNRDNQGTPTGSLKGIAGAANLKRVRIDDVEVKDVYGRSIETNNEGLLADALGDEAEDIVITGCFVRNGGQKGVDVRRSKYVTVANCVVDGKGVNDANADTAFEASRSQYVTFTGNTARNQTATLGPGYRVVNDSHYVTVVGNVAEGGRQGLVCIDATDVVFANNVLTGTQDGCLISSTDGDANGWVPTERITVANNTFVNPDDDGIVVSVDTNGTACNDIVLSNNILHDDGSNVMDYGIRLAPGTGTIGCREHGNTIINAQTADKSGTFQSVDFGSDVTVGGPRIIAGSGSPEGVVTADVGSLYMRTDGGASTTFYVKESGAGNTGWDSK